MNEHKNIFTKGPLDVLDHDTSEVTHSSKLAIGATRDSRAKSSHAPWAPSINMDESERRNIDALFSK